MKKNIDRILFSMILIFLILSCEMDECISCIAENAQGIVVAQQVECDNSKDYVRGFEDGFKQAQEANGNTVRCSKFQTD